MRMLKNVAGLLNLNKPSGITSRSAVNQITRVLPKVKIGHAGTLDPLASGILVVCLGPATRLIESVQAMPKTYRVTVRLDATSDTLDADGRVVPVSDPVIPGIETIQEALTRQTGMIEQMPPAFSALKIQGVRAYELARSGQAVVLAPRRVMIHQIILVSYRWPRLDLEIVCGGGTYIRSIARDLGAVLGCGGLLEVLTRTRIGPFSLESAIEPADVTADSLIHQIRPALEAVPDLPRVQLSPEQVAEIARGKVVRVPPLPLQEPAGSSVALLDPSGNLVAIGELSATRDAIQPRKVMIDDGP
jgi:tRNA pseudouridine55 synthase